AGSGRRLAWKPAIPSLRAGSRRRSDGDFTCAAPTSASLSAAARPAGSPARCAHVWAWAAAAAISGAFGAPLAGAFYAFELVIGGYTPASLTPVGVAAGGGYICSPRV